jgi:hypothetical protein
MDAMAPQITSGEFEKLVRKHYGFLEEDFGFSMRKLNDWAFLAETRDTRVSVYLEHHSVLVVEIEPIGEGAGQLLRQSILPESMTVLSIFKYYNAELKYAIERLDEKNFVDNVPVELEKRAALLKKYCTKILQGDYSDWPKIERYLSDITYGEQ